MCASLKTSSAPSLSHSLQAATRLLSLTPYGGEGCNDTLPRLNARPSREGTTQAEDSRAFISEWAPGESLLHQLVCADLHVSPPGTCGVGGEGAKGACNGAKLAVLEESQLPGGENELGLEWLRMLLRWGRVHVVEY